MPNKMEFSFNEMYPGMSTSNTLDTETTPEAEDQKALVQDALVADLASVSGAKKTSILSTLLVLAMLAFFMGFMK